MIYVPCLSSHDPQFVGDPVDTLSGVVVDQTLDFRLVGPIELRWWRYYDSSQHKQILSLGRGHAHEYDWRLSATGSALMVREPLGREIEFPYLKLDGEVISRQGTTLKRLSLRRYIFQRHGMPTMLFEFAAPNLISRVSKLYHGRHEVNFAYDGNLRLMNIRDSVGRLIDVEEEGGVLQRLIIQTSSQANDHHASRLLMEYRYDNAGNLIETRNGQGHGHRFEYDDSNRMTLRRGRTGFCFRFRYDSQGRCVLAAGDERLYGVALSFKIPGRITNVTRPDGGVWRYEFSAAGELSRITNPMGASTQYIRDMEHRRTLELDSLGNATRILYNKAGAVIAKIDPLGRKYNWPNDPNEPGFEGRRVASKPIEYEFGRLFDCLEKCISSHDEINGLQVPTDIAALLVIRARKPEKNERPSFEVKPIGACWWPQPAQGRVFNELGKLVEQHDSHGRKRRWFYDPAGNLARYQDYDGGVWNYDHGAWHFLKRRISPIGAEIKYTHTAYGEVATFEDALGNLSEYRYDLADNLIEVRRHGVVKEVYVRDKIGNLIEKYDGDGRELMRVKIGQANLPVRRLFSCGERHELAYDAVGRLKSARTGQDEYASSYDRLGNLCLDSRNQRGIATRFGAWGCPIDQVYLGRFVVRYLRMSDGSVKLTDSGGKVHKIRTWRGSVGLRIYSNGNSELTQHDEAGRCVFKSALRNNEIDWIRRYCWSGEGKLLSVFDSATDEVEFQYDTAHRLTGRRVGGAVEQFHYDIANNLVAQPGLGGVTLQSGNRLLMANDEEFTYDNRNHVASRQKKDHKVRYRYDGRDQLVEVYLPQGRWTAAYDTLGRRVRKLWQGQVTEYYWNGDQLAAEVCEDGSVRLYVYADPLALTPMMMLDYAALQSHAAECKRYFIYADHLGAPVLIEDERGEPVWRARIAPFGCADVASTSKIVCHLRWPGHYFDPETGLHYNRFRYYDPIIGRYLQSDPWGIAGGPNLYAYFTNPLAAVDVRGLGDESDRPARAKEDEESTAVPTPHGEGHEHDAASAFPNLERGGANSDMHADRVVAAMQNTRPPIKQNRSVTVIEHQNGTVSVGISGGDPRRAGDAQRLVGHLNEAHPNDPPTYRTTSGPVDASGLNDPGSRANPSPMPGTCSEPQAAQAAGTSDSPPQAYQTVWSGPKECPAEHQMTDRPTTPVGNEQMQPCNTCRNNTDNYTNSSMAGSSS